MPCTDGRHNRRRFGLAECDGRHIYRHPDQQGVKIILLKLGVCHRGLHMRTIFDDLADVDWFNIAELYCLAFPFVLIVTMALMFGSVLLFWARYPRDLHL